MMTLIVSQKHMNSQKLIVVAFSAIALTSCGNPPSELAVEKKTQNSGRTFADWCRDKDLLNPETKHTVEVLLKEALTTDCDAADRTLSSITRLDLKVKDIKDLKPLESLITPSPNTNQNRISDIKPLQSLINLIDLRLGENKISDIKPLQSLTKLTNLDLRKNQISDIKPLQSLTNLKWLFLQKNQINDIKPLKLLTNLTNLDLENNKISDIKPLGSLTKLTLLELSENPAPKTCPIKPESICHWKN
jgi:Leucine Rich repeats (2 copies)